VRLRTFAGWLIAALLLAAGQASPAFAREEILSYISQIEVQPDGTLDVTETIRVRAERRQIRRGIYRDFPTRYTRDDGLYQRAGFKVLQILKNGQPEPYHTETQAFGVRVYIGDKDVFIPAGVYTYTIRYRTTRQLRFFADHDELYWNVTGNFWTFPILAAEARVQLPEGARIGELNAYTGPLGASGRDFRIVSQTDRTFVIETTRPFRAREGLTVVATWQKGVVPEPTGGERMFWLVWDNLGLVVLFAGAALVALYFTHAWQKVGRDPDRGTIIPLFEPPDGVSPAAASYLHFWGFRKARGTRPLAFMAAIISLAVKGLIRMDQQGRTLTLETAGNDRADPPGGEAAILSKLRVHSGRLAFKKSNARKVSSMRSAFRKAVSREYGRHYIRNNTGYFILGFLLSIATIVGFFLLQMPPPDQVAPLIFALVGGVFGSGLFLLGVAWLGDLLPGGGSKILGALFFVIGVGLLLSLTGFAFQMLDGVLFLAALVIPLLAGLNIAFLHLLRAPTAAGRALLDRIEGFKLYLSVAESERMNMAGAPDVTTDIFERYLPYAIGLNVEKPWSQAFASHIARATPDKSRSSTYHPAWYNGNSFSTASLSAATGAMVAAMSSSIASATPSSSGSGGGGSSGGGGGGGGGGGW
jgi:hypothetical protein